MEAAYGTRVGGAVGSAAPASAHETDARPGEKIARKDGRLLERYANEMDLRTNIGIFTYASGRKHALRKSTYLPN